MGENLFEQDLPEQVRLAQRNGIKDILIANPQITGNERMLLRRMSRVFYISDPYKAKELWERISPQTERKKIALAIDSDTFFSIHQQTQNFLQGEGSKASLEALIRSYRERNSPRGSGYRWNDAHQVSQGESRSLAQLKISGI